MRRRQAAAIAVIASTLIGACTSSHAPAARALRPAAVSPTPSASPLRLGRSTPPSVRLFAGTASILGTAVRYCSGGDCASRQIVPPRLTAPAGSVVTIAVGRVPTRAVLDVAGQGGGRYVLGPGTLMAWKERLPAGSHRLTLTLDWGDGAGTWVFQLAGRG